MPTVPALRRLRQRLALSQADLASRAGVARSTIVSAEQGVNPRPSTIRRLAVALGCEPSDLLDVTAVDQIAGRSEVRMLG